ncbi:snare-like protein [Saitoella complicata NRRL Y-17804]|uniref:snare-like protein n=1 Tax=Saitoella complicata (strain BCRC 22490 / CBS 7301 / JCM 7358 / NBRC 10748 / NRRL Y-17804) TaxID=698492 RepID=UPI0008672F10|nr:snare-like protein [Saitoella complicata NRRL Y-17804]ODQ54998.1 snare-like protein [Saitoella complicata NRRL Y-17804]
MTIYEFYVFDRHCECIYYKEWNRRPDRSTPQPSADGNLANHDNAKLLFGVIYSIRNMTKKLSGQSDNSFVSYRTSKYKTHYYETPSLLKFVLITSPNEANMRQILHQIFVNLWVEYVVKNPLSPVEHTGGKGVAVELFELGLETFVRGLEQFP